MYLTSVNSQLIFFVYILFKKDTKIKKGWNILKEMNSLKKAEGVPLLNFEGGPGVPLLNFEGVLGVPLLNFRGVPGTTFKLWGVSRVSKSRVPGSWSHFYAMSEKITDNELFLFHYFTWKVKIPSRQTTLFQRL